MGITPIASKAIASPVSPHAYMVARSGIEPDCDAYETPEFTKTLPRSDYLIGGPIPNRTVLSIRTTGLQPVSNPTWEWTHWCFEMESNHHVSFFRRVLKPLSYQSFINFLLTLTTLELPPGFEIRIPSALFHYLNRSLTTR